MKSLIFISALFLVSANLSAQKNSWKLVWSDEFNYSGKPDSTKWGYELGDKRNYEKQCFTNSLKNAYVQGGYLHIVGLKETVPNPNYKSGGTEWWQKDPTLGYTSASIVTKDKRTFRYGRFDIRAKVPQGKGIWPVLWLLGVDKERLSFPRVGEIDILETWGYKDNKAYGSLHYGDAVTGQHVRKEGIYTASEPLYKSFHVYSLIWTPHYISILIDNKEYNKVDLDKEGGTYKALGLDSTKWNSDIVYRKKDFYILLSLALGGTAGKEIDDSIFPADLQIDYVRVYQKARY